MPIAPPPTTEQAHIASAIAWLKRATMLIMGFGLLITASATSSLQGPSLLLVDMAFWPLDGRETLAARETRLALGIMGGLTVGLGVMIWMVADRVLPRDPAAARAIILTGMVTWFIIDSLGSTLAGAPLNTLLNAPFLGLIAWPFWRNGVGATART